MESTGMDLQQHSASGGSHRQPREPSGPVADAGNPASSSHAAMTSESGPDRHGLTPHPPALQHPGQPSHKPHRPRHVQLVSPREHDEPNAAPQPCETQNPHGLNMDNTPQAQPPEHDDRRPASPTEATATTPPAPDASALSTAAADNASRPTTVSQAWLSRHSIHSNAIRSRLEHQRQHHDPNAATHRRAGVSHHGKSADEWRPYELQRALSKAATQLPERTKLGDQVISKVLALTRWKTKAREKAESRPVSMHARTPWLQQLQQLTRRRNGVIGSGLEHDGTDPLVAFMLQDSQAAQDLRLQLAEELQQQELTPMEAIQERVEAAVEGVRRWHAEQRAARRAASAAASRAQGRTGGTRSALRKGRTSPGIPLLVPRPPGPRPGASEPGAADGGAGQGVGGDGGGGEGMGTAEEAGSELGVEAFEGELGEGEYYDEFGDEDEDLDEEDDYDPWNDGELHEDEEEDGEEGEEGEEGDGEGQEAGCGEQQQGADGYQPELLVDGGAAAGADAAADGEEAAQADGGAEQGATVAGVASAAGAGGGRDALAAMSGALRRALKSRNARSSRDNDWGFILQQMPCLTKRGDRQQLLERYQSRRSGAGAAIAAHNAEGAGAEGTPRFGTPSRATPQGPRTPGGGRVVTAGLDGLSPAGPTPRAGHEGSPRPHRLSHSRGGRPAAAPRRLPQPAGVAADGSRGHGTVEGSAVEGDEGLDGEEDEGSWEGGEDSWSEDGSSSSGWQEQGSGESRHGEGGGSEVGGREEGLAGAGGEGGTPAQRRRRRRRRGRRKSSKHGQEAAGEDAGGAGTAQSSADEGEEGPSSDEEEGDQEDGGEVSEEQQGDGGGKEGRGRRRARRRRRRKRRSKSRGKGPAEGPPSPRKACSMPAILPGSLPPSAADDQQHPQSPEGSVPLPSFRSTAGDSSPFTQPDNRHLRLSQGSRAPSGLASAPELSPSGSSNTSPVTAVGGSGSRGSRLFGSSGGKPSRLPGVAWPGSGQATGHPQCRPQQRPWAFLPIMHESFPAGPLVRQARASYPDDSLIPLDQFMAHRHAAAASTGSGGALSPVAHVHEERVDAPTAETGQGPGAGTRVGRGQRARRASMYAGAAGSGRCKGEGLPNLLPEHVPLRPVDPDTLQRNRLLRPPRDSQSGAPLASQASQLSLMQSLDSLKQNSCPHLGARLHPAASTSCNASLPPLTRGEGPCGAGSSSPVPPPPPHPTPVPTYSAHAQLQAQAQAQRQHALAAAQAQGLGQEVSFSQLFPHADRETSFTVLPGLRVSHQVPVPGMPPGMLYGVGCSASPKGFGGGAGLGLGLGLGMGQAPANSLPALGKKAMPKGGGFRYA